MLATTAHNLVQNFDKTCDSVIQNCEPIIITRSNDNNVVLISQAEYENLMKNLYSHKEKQISSQFFTTEKKSIILS